MQDPESPTPSIASRTPCSSLVSSWSTSMPNLSRYSAMATSRSGTAIPTWSMAVNRWVGRSLALMWASLGRGSGTLNPV